ncbi:MAG: methyltransferase domain-containing protein, partial [Bacteroidota bacterium]
MSEQMEFTGERFVPSRELMNDEIAFEHLHRYYTALELVKGKVVLDIACGEGYGSAILSANADKVFGIDIDANTINHAKKKYDKDNIEFLCGSADNIPLADNLIDVIISYETIEHLDEEAQKNFLADVKRVLKKDGILVISTPDKANYTDRFSYTNEFHVKEFEKEEFILLLKKYFTHIRLFLQGYEIIDAITEETPDSIGELAVVNWQRETKLFSRKYLIAICCDIHKTDFHFSSAVFQVNKNYLGLMEDFMDKEAHIVELGNWGHTLDKEINEKKALIQSQQQTIEKQGVTMENLLLHEAEKTKLVQGLEERLDRAEESVSLLKAKVEEYLSAIQTLEKVNNDKETTIQQQKEKEYSL